MGLFVCVCLCMFVWVLLELQNERKATALNVTHTHMKTFGIGRYFGLYNGISNISETFNQPEMIWKILKERIYELSFVFSSLSPGFSHRPPYFILMRHYIRHGTLNLLTARQQYGVWLIGQNLWNNCFDIALWTPSRCRKITTFMLKMRLQCGIDDWSEIALNDDTLLMTKQIGMQEISQHQFIIEKR